MQQPCAKKINHCKSNEAGTRLAGKHGKYRNIENNTLAQVSPLFGEKEDRKEKKKHRVIVGISHGAKDAFGIRFAKRVQSKGAHLYLIPVQRLNGMIKTEE